MIKANFWVLPMVISLIALASCVNTPTDAPVSETDMGYTIPAGKAWADGKEIRFTHTEVSDADLAVLLTDMMGSPVLLVPSLASIPDSLLADVYVFSNGIKGTGPLKYQADVFNKPPLTTGYTPLRRLHVVTWTDSTLALVLKSESEITTAKNQNKVTVETKPVVINMPFIVWTESQR